MKHVIRVHRPKIPKEEEARYLQLVKQAAADLIRAADQASAKMKRSKYI